MSETVDWEFWIDTGGTFTDCLGRHSSGKWYRAKVLSSSSLRAGIRRVGTRSLIIEIDNPYVDDFFAGFKVRFRHQAMEAAVLSYKSETYELFLDRDLPSDLVIGDWIDLRFEGEAPELGARVITQTPGNSKLPKSQLRLATTKGTNALLEGKGAKTVLFTNEGLKDLLRINTQQRPDLFSLNRLRPEPLHAFVVEVQRDGSSGSLDADSILELVKAALDRGAKAAAICLMHSYQDGSEERELSDFLRSQGFPTVVTSSDCAPFIKLLPRAETTLVDAYLSPVLNAYLDRIETEFAGEGLSVMNSTGGLVPRSSFRAKDSLFSGPAGGVIGAVGVGTRAGFSKIIGFDMGGTSTDVTRFDGALAYQFETQVADVRIMAPSLKIETVAAGGGSICRFDGERLRVGPESAGAEPGPACYGTGGPLTVTDLNLLLGRMDARQFGLPVNLRKSWEQFQLLAHSLDARDDELLLSGLLEITNENMADAIRKISTGEGFDPSNYALVAFGGAGGQHACGIAEKLGIAAVLFPEDAGLLSASGLSRAVLEGFAERQTLCSFRVFEDQVDSLSRELEREALEKLNPLDRGKVEMSRRIVSLRLSGQESALDVDWMSGDSPLDRFSEQYHAIFGYYPDVERVEVVCYRVVVAGAEKADEEEIFSEAENPPKPIKQQRAFSRGEWLETNVFSRSSLEAGTCISGPAIVQDPFSTLFVDSGWSGCVGSLGTFRLLFSGDNERVELRNTEQVELELYSNRFQTLVEEMGVRLMRTAVSTNVKDRLDFSCGLLDADGRLVINAPHIPVHLGALGMCVRAISKTHSWKKGEMLVTNHPGRGGSHLPDVTVVCPVFSDSEELLGFLVNRAHHAELGGIAPGSMPPAATCLAEEGVVIPPIAIMSEGELMLEGVESLLRLSRYPSRRVEENLSDLKAQVASNLKGLEDILSLIHEVGADVVSHYMSAIQNRAETSLRRKLAGLTDGKYEAVQKLDDGTPIEMEATVHGDSMTIAFSECGGVHSGNFNATPGIVYSAVIYFLRVWLNEPMPLNEGLLRPVEIEIPVGLLNPPFVDDPEKCPPVVAGNVETSQRLVDTLLLAFEVVACGQGTMNNLVFGNDRISFYETIAGGAGAGDGFDGASGVHVHMTNTGITDPEILEHRFPVKLREFSIRKGSGGAGKFRGGDGVIRELEFIEPLTLSMLTQHRVEAPYGLKGGQAGKRGEQWLFRPGEPPVRLNSTDRVDILPGDRIRVLTPGGGGWGEPG